KILDIEAAFSREWRLEERLAGYRMPGLVERLAATTRKLSLRNAQALAKKLAATTERLGTGSTAEGFAALQAMRPLILAGGHADAQTVVDILDGTREIARP